MTVLFYDRCSVVLVSECMLRHFLKYTLVLLMLFQSWHGVMAAPVQNVQCDAAMSFEHGRHNAHQGVSGDCKHTQHKQLCAQACAMPHALLGETIYTFGAIRSVQMDSVVLPLTGISHRPLIPPPIQHA